MDRCSTRWWVTLRAKPSRKRSTSIWAKPFQGLPTKPGRAGLFLFLRHFFNAEARRKREKELAVAQSGSMRIYLYSSASPRSSKYVPGNQLAGYRFFGARENSPAGAAGHSDPGRQEVRQNRRMPSPTFTATNARRRFTTCAASNA